VSDARTTGAAAEGEVHLHIDGPVASVVFDRPAARNALTWHMYEELTRACDAIDADPAIRVAVFRGAGGKAFVAGTDIAQFRTFASGEDGLDYEYRLAAHVARVGGLRVPSIAVVEGLAVGGGMSIATLCDFRVTTPGARFGVPIARTLGNCLSAGNLRMLKEALGLPMVKRMLILAELVPAEELLASGFVLSIAAPEALDAEVAALCERIAGYAPITIAVTRTLLARLAEGVEESDEALIRHCYGSADFHEGVDAFVNKRPARWTGR
jgi:enoyl-CoA hydratase/carnithine racemase